MSIDTSPRRYATNNTAVVNRKRRLPFAQLVGLIVLFAALSAGTTFAQAGWEKWRDPAWTGQQSGVAMKGFLAGATFKAKVTKTNPFPDVLPVWNSLNQHVIAHHLQLFGWLVVLGELLIPLGVIALLCVRFAGSRLALAGVATLAVGLNLLYLHEGSAGDNAPMLLLWLTVLIAAVVFPEAAQAHAIDLGRFVRRLEAEPRPSAAMPSREQLAATGALLFLLVLESLLLHSAATVLLLGVVTVALAVAFRCINRAVAGVSWRGFLSGARPALSGSRLDVE